jgi:hypothetical protein
MRPTNGLWYLFGQRRAILELATWRQGIWAGLILVVLTGVARNYDQEFILENPLKWLLGSLLFSIVSGSWLYVVLYGWFARREMKYAEAGKPDFWSGWRLFMGLFWLTAPVAWLFAIPVERFFDSLTAAKLNLALLAVVSLWRVLLMARVMQVVTAVSFWLALVWVLLASAVEVCVVFFFGGGFAKAIMSAMGGLRNSPEEDLLFSAMSTVFGVAFWTCPVALIVALLWRARQPLSRFAEPQPAPLPRGSLALLAVFWAAVAILPQRELAHSSEVEHLIAEGKPRAALDYLAAHQPSDFAPARALPPKPYEYEFFEELPACIGAVQPADPPWVRAHLLRRLDLMVSHYGPRWMRRNPQALYPREQQIKHVEDGIQWLGPDAAGLIQLFDGLDKIPEGRAWLRTNEVFLEGVRSAAREMPQSYRRGAKSEADQKSGWLTLSNRLAQLAGPERNP